MFSKKKPYSSKFVVLILVYLCHHFFAATNFSKIIAELETTQQSLLTSIAGNKVLLQNVQEAFATNLESVKTEVTKLETRFNAVAK